MVYNNTQYCMRRRGPSRPEYNHEIIEFARNNNNTNPSAMYLYSVGNELIPIHTTSYDGCSHDQNIYRMRGTLYIIKLIVLLSRYTLYNIHIIFEI